MTSANVFISKGEKKLEKALGNAEPPKWCTNSYIFPPTFSCRSPRVCFFEGENGPSGGKKISRRNKEKMGIQYGDDAELIVYAAVESLGLSMNPLVAFRSITIDRTLINYLESNLNGLSFPFENELLIHGSTIGEVDLLFVHRNAGVVIVEVKAVNEGGNVLGKSSHAFTGLQFKKQFFAAIVDFVFGTSHGIPIQMVAAFPFVRAFDASVRQKAEAKGIELIGRSTASDTKNDLEFIFDAGKANHGGQDWYPKLVPLLANIFDCANGSIIKDRMISWSLEDETKKIEKQKFKKVDVSSLHGNNKIPLKVLGIVALTPEQELALKGPNRQIISGHAGTGKTVILQLKVFQHLSETFEIAGQGPSLNDLNLRVYGRGASHVRYAKATSIAIEKLSNGQIDFTWTGVPSSWCRDHDTMRKDFPLSFEAIKNYLSNGHLYPTRTDFLEYMFTDTQVRQELNATRDHYVIVDDLSINEELDIAVFVAACMHHRIFRTFWVATEINKLPGDSLSVDNPKTLKTVVRHSKSVYNSNHNLVLRNNSCDECGSFIGHRFVGFTVRNLTINVPKPNLSSAGSSLTLFESQIAQRVKEQLDYFISYGEIGKTAVLVDSRLISPTSEDRKPNVVMIDLDVLRRSLFQLNVAAETALEQAKNGRCVAVDIPENCYSMDWPLVVYVRLCSSARSALDRLALTRCTTALVILDVLF